jgi:hypothetical protein
MGLRDERRRVFFSRAIEMAARCLGASARMASIMLEHSGSINALLEQIERCFVELYDVVVLLIAIYRL